MKKLTVLGSCAFCFLLGTLVPIATTRAQTQPKTIYYNLSFMKSLPGKDPLSVEKKWTSIHTDLVKSGVIKSWSVLRPVYYGAHNYDYMTLITFADSNAYNNLDYLPFFKKNWGEDKWQSVLKETTDTRDMVGSEIWETVTSVP